MAGEEQEKNYALASYLEEIQRLVAAYQVAKDSEKNFPEAEKRIREELKKIVDKADKIDSSAVSEETRKILEFEKPKDWGE